MPLEGTAEETQVVTAYIRLITLLNEEILLVHDAVCRQNLHRLGPCGMHRLVLGLREREQLRQLHTVCHGDVRVLADDAALLHREQWKLALKCGGFHYVSHTLRFFEVAENSRWKLLRLMMWRGRLRDACNFMSPNSP